MSRNELTAVVRKLAARVDRVHPAMLVPVALLTVAMIALAALTVLVLLAALVLTSAAAAVGLCLDRALHAAADWQPHRKTTAPKKLEVAA